MGGGCDARALLFDGVVILLYIYIYMFSVILNSSQQNGIGRNLRDKLLQNIINNVIRRITQISKVILKYALKDFGGLWATSRFQDSKKMDHLPRSWIRVSILGPFWVSVWTHWILKGPKISAFR